MISQELNQNLLLSLIQCHPEFPITNVCMVSLTLISRYCIADAVDRSPVSTEIATIPQISTAVINHEVNIQIYSIACNIIINMDRCVLITSR